jgi:HSP20 family protein
MQHEPHTLAASLAPSLEPFAMVRNLMRWDPFREMSFDFDSQAGFTPSFDIRETPEAYLFEADLPGISPADLDISLAGNRLAITGRREGTSKAEGENRYTMERSFGCFCRSFNLPEGVDPDGIQADLKEGVLTLVLPKTPEVQPKKISLGH